MKFPEFFYGTSVVLWVVSGFFLGLIAIRNSVWFGPSRSVLEELRPFDKKLAKIGGIFFVIGTFLFVIGTLIP